MVEAFASLGSNQDREHNIISAVRALREHYGDLRLSPVYRNAAVGFEGDDFYNMVVAFETSLSPREIQRQFRSIEDAHGRKRQAEKFASRQLDIDLILYGDEVLEEDGLKLPREDIERYAFVLLPLADLVPQGRHPVLGKTFLEMWQEYDDGQVLQAVTLDFPA